MPSNIPTSGQKMGLAMETFQVLSELFTTEPLKSHFSLLPLSTHTQVRR